MIYCFHLIDAPHSEALRTEVRPRHKAYLATVADRIAFAGPLLAEDGRTMVGSLLAIDFPNRAAALQWLSQEPFTKAGLYASVSVYAFSNLWPQKQGFPPAAAS
ncbi:YciI family protein [Parapusillimonas granuli]|uniref:YciI family protein n=1 Tax=Parapusillimonas granuli TaxID=380911 RepID=A0A853FYF4_9BURK|nr:YciI family protein [Parapusillimonas granuli]MBB5214464.1 hypothetical protein [Parapusillimonas granuli]NYT49127.1 YciI family protein [Parapusillimonas granuli]